MIDILLNKLGSYDLVENVLSYDMNTANILKRLMFLSDDFLKVCEAHEKVCMGLEKLEIQLFNIEEDINQLGEEDNEILVNYLNDQLCLIKLDKKKLERKEEYEFKCINLYGKLFRGVNDQE